MFRGGRRGTAHANRARRTFIRLHQSPIALVVLLAFGAQSFLTQTHVLATHHGTSHAVEHALAENSDSPAPKNGQPASPGPDNNALCHVCQVLSTAGAALLTSTSDLTLSLRRTGISVVADSPRFILRLGHSWRSRAPPTRP